MTEREILMGLLKKADNSAASRGITNYEDEGSGQWKRCLRKLFRAATSLQSK